jgi:hypothetical protein
MCPFTVGYQGETWPQLNWGLPNDHLLPKYLANIGCILYRIGYPCETDLNLIGVHLMTTYHPNHLPIKSML